MRDDLSFEADGRDAIRRGSSARRILWLGALLSGGLFAIGSIRRLRRKKESARHTESLRDKSLKDTFPASDPPASQYFDIPVNRQ